MDRLVADGAFPPCLLPQGQVVEDAGPAVDVTTAGHLGGCRVLQADGAARSFSARHTLKHTPMNIVNQVLLTTMSYQVLHYKT